MLDCPLVAASPCSDLDLLGVFDESRPGVLGGVPVISGPGPPPVDRAEIIGLRPPLPSGSGGAVAHKALQPPGGPDANEGVGMPKLPVPNEPSNEGHGPLLAGGQRSRETASSVRAAAPGEREDFRTADIFVFIYLFIYIV